MMHEFARNNKFRPFGALASVGYCGLHPTLPSLRLCDKYLR